MRQNMARTEAAEKVGKKVQFVLGLQSTVSSFTVIQLLG